MLYNVNVNINNERFSLTHSFIVVLVALPPGFIIIIIIIKIIQMSAERTL